MPSTPSFRSSRLLAILPLLAAAALLTACQSHEPADEPAADASTRPIPEKGPKRPADLTPPPPPSPGHLSR